MKKLKLLMIVLAIIATITLAIGATRVLATEGEVSNTDEAVPTTEGEPTTTDDGTNRRYCNRWNRYTNNR